MDWGQTATLIGAGVAPLVGLFVCFLWKLSSRIDRVFISLNRRIDGVISHMADLSARIDALSARMDDLSSRVGRLEGALLPGMKAFKEE